MATRTIPSLCPSIQIAELGVGRSARADLIRRFALTQNWLWANLRRCYSFWANDGEGNFVDGASVANISTAPAVGGWEDPGIVDMPGGSGKGLCVATFVFPPPPVGNTSARFQGRASFSREVGTASVRVTLHELDAAETFTGDWAETTTTADGTWDWVIDDFAVPSARPIVGKIWIGGYLGASATGPSAGVYDRLTLFNVSARWLPPPTYGIAATNEAPFEPIDPATAVADRCLDTPLLDGIRRQLASLVCSRGQTEILQTWFGQTNQRDGNSGTVEVARYTVYVSAGVNEISGKIYALYTEATHTPRIIVAWNGSAVATLTPTFTPYAVQAIDFSFAPGAHDVEGVLTVAIEIERLSNPAAFTINDHGLEVLGVFAWESAIDTADWPAAAPANYAPLDEARLLGNDDIAANLEHNEGARTGISHLLNNGLWLAQNRLRSLVGDWRRRVLKRIADENGNQVGTYVGAFWDWTRGLHASTLQSSKPKNITVRGDLATNDGWARGAANHDDLDGFGLVASGYSDTGAGGVATSWPATQAYRGHGRRLAVWPCVVPAGLTMHPSDAEATSTFWVRAARRRPALMGPTFNGSTLGPAIEESYWANRGSIEIDWPTTGGLSFPIRSTAPGYVDDYRLRWLDSQTKLSYKGEGTARGRLPIAFIPLSSANVLEGTLFEVELTSLLVMDDPLPLTSLALLA